MVLQRMSESPAQPQQDSRAATPQQSQQSAEAQQQQQQAQVQQSQSQTPQPQQQSQQSQAAQQQQNEQQQHLQEQQAQQQQMVIRQGTPVGGNQVNDNSGQQVVTSQALIINAANIAQHQQAQNSAQAQIQVSRSNILVNSRTVGVCCRRRVLFFFVEIDVFVYCSKYPCRLQVCNSSSNNNSNSCSLRRSWLCSNLRVPIRLPS